MRSLLLCFFGNESTSQPLSLPVALRLALNGGLAKALDTTADYLVNDDVNDPEVTAQLTDRELLKQFKEVESLNAEDKHIVKVFIDAFLTKRHIQEYVK